ncbi:MAG: ABC transporter substrate-binding protein, partial [Firmicutes bacterium]|nr:ABC transporter substrate-binding protein [Bacillota bacterium]
LIVAIATPAAQAAAAATSTIPIVFSGVTDPIAAGLVENLASPSANITGVSDAIDVEGILQFALDLLPSIQTFGFVYNLGEINSVSLIAEARDFLESQGLSYLEAPVTNTGEVQQAALSLVGNVDAFFTPTDNTVASAMPVFAQVALNAGLPIFTGADSMVHDGGLATVGIDYAIIGAETATVVSQILGGTDISQIPVFYTTNFQPIVNLATANALGINIDHLGDYVELYEGN